jgi:hypothetical protein
VTGEGTNTWTWRDGLLDLKTNDAIKVDCSNNLTREDIDYQKVSGTQWEKDLWAAILPVSDAADKERDAATEEDWAKEHAAWASGMSAAGYTDIPASTSA